MSCYVDFYRNMLVLRCDGCGTKVDLWPDQTDRLLANIYMKENGWKAMKLKSGKWIQICPDCKSAYYSAKRESWLKKMSEEKA